MTDNRGQRIGDINRRLAAGEAVVLTVSELKARLRAGARVTLGDIDVVTTATHGIMSGTAAAFSVEVGKAGSFVRGTRAWLNGVPAMTGPAPNERLGAVDMTVHGTAASRDAPKTYGGGHLFRDLVERKEVMVEVETESGAMVRRRTTLDDFDFARLISVRNVFQGYMVFGNFRSAEPIESIFSPVPMTATSGVTAVGSGEVNPLQNDPSLATIGPGSLVYVNDAPGTVLGEGTRSKPDRPNLSLAADMDGMDPTFMGGVATSEGPEILNGVAIPIPVLDEGVLERLVKAMDETLALPIADVSDRKAFQTTTYGEVWIGRDVAIGFDAARAKGCGPDCRCAAVCPTGALRLAPDPVIDRTRCTNCGACVAACRTGAASGDFGHVVVAGRAQPITYRTSDRTRAATLAERLKQRLLAGEVLLPVPARIRPKRA